eukprot:gene19486-26148_t
MTPPVYKSPFSSSKCASGQAVRPSAQAMSIPKSQDNGFSKAGYPQFCGLSTSPMDFGTDFGLFCSDAFPAGLRMAAHIFAPKATRSIQGHLAMHGHESYFSL